MGINKKSYIPVFIFIVVITLLISGLIKFENRKLRPCYEANLPSLKLCLPRSYFTFKNFSKEDKVGYDWATFFLPITNDVEAGNQLTLLIPRSTLQIFPPEYDEGKDGMVTISLRPLTITPHERQVQYEHYQGNKVYKTKDKNVFIHCDHYDNERGNPSAKEYCLLKIDWDSNIKNPRIELSFSIAPSNFEKWQINADKVRKFLLSYAVNRPNTVN